MNATTGQEKSKKMNGYLKPLLQLGAAGVILALFVYPAWKRGLDYMDTAKEELPKQSASLLAIEKKVGEQDTDGVIRELKAIKEANDDAAEASRKCHVQQAEGQAALLENQRTITENQTAILGRMNF